MGRTFEELPLTTILDQGRRVTFIYGDCEIPFGSDGGCAPPLEVQVWPIRERPPGIIGSVVGSGPDDAAEGLSDMIRCRKVTVRGAPGAFYSGDLDLYVGGWTVVIFADSKARTLRAAEALRPVDAERATEGDLPSPTIDPGPALERCS